jgi:hypothetical protein
MALEDKEHWAQQHQEVESRLDQEAAQVVLVAVQTESAEPEPTEQ